MFDIAKLREIIEKSKYMIPKSLAAVETLVFISFRVLGEPAFLHPLFLIEQLFDGPEGREGKHAQQGREDDVADKNRGGYPCYTQ